MALQLDGISNARPAGRAYAGPRGAPLWLYAVSLALAGIPSTEKFLGHAAAAAHIAIVAAGGWP